MLLVNEYIVLLFHFKVGWGDNGTVYYVDLLDNAVIKHEKMLDLSFYDCRNVCYDKDNNIVYFCLQNSEVLFINMDDLVPLEANKVMIIKGFVKEFGQKYNLVIPLSLVHVIAFFFPTNC